jgi:alpha-D-ribose 1-methylphosphonate 5-triphosphate diphosphatase
MHSMIGASLAACPGGFSAAAAARAMGDPVLLPAAQEDRLRDLLRSRLGDALVSGGAPQRLLPLVLDLAGPDLAGLPQLWPLLSERPAEIMRLADRGRLDLGCRADLIVVSRMTGQIEATISAGRLIHLAGHACARFARAGITGITGLDQMPMAAE